MGVCRSTGCKVTSCQSWRMILSSGNRTQAALVRFEVGRVAGFFSDLQLWQLEVLQPFDPQRLTIPLGKDLKLLNLHSINSKDYKNTSCQSWRSKKNPAARPESSQTRAARVRVLDDQIIFKVWQTTTLQPFDLQRLTVPLLKDLNLLSWHIV